MPVNFRSPNWWHKQPAAFGIARFALRYEPPKPDFPIGRYSCPEGRGTRAISDNFNGAIYRVTRDGASVGRWFLEIESRKAAYAQGKQARTAE